MNKKKWIILMMLLIAFAFSACAGKTEKGEEANASNDRKQKSSASAPKATPIPDDYVIDWIDFNLEEAIRAETEIYDRDILYGDVKGITSLYLSGNNISDISALSSLVNLEYLFLQKNNITDYSPVEHVPEWYK